MKWISNSPEETQALGARLRNEFPHIKVICLKGPLGSGKTHFTKGIGQSLGIPPEQIKSPTFTTLMEHRGDKILYHCDFYRWEEESSSEHREREGEALYGSAGWRGRREPLPMDWWHDLLDQPNGLIVAEWSERLQGHLPSERIEVAFQMEGLLHEDKPSLEGHSKRTILIQSYP